MTEAPSTFEGNEHVFSSGETELSLEQCAELEQELKAGAREVFGAVINETENLTDAAERYRVRKRTAGQEAENILRTAVPELYSLVPQQQKEILLTVCNQLVDENRGYFYLAQAWANDYLRLADENIQKARQTINAEDPPATPFSAQYPPADVDTRAHSFSNGRTV